jgi:hypothetical protein
LETGRVEINPALSKPMMKIENNFLMKKLMIIVEKQQDDLTGRVTYDDNLIVVSAAGLGELEQKLRILLNRFHEVDPAQIEFQYKYDLSSLFDAFDVLKVSNVATLAGVNPSLLRQYVIGNKHASAAQAKRIEAVIHKLGKDLAAVQIYGL